MSADLTIHLSDTVLFYICELAVTGIITLLGLVWSEFCEHRGH